MNDVEVIDNFTGQTQVSTQSKSWAFENGAITAGSQIQPTPLGFVTGQLLRVGVANLGAGRHSDVLRARVLADFLQ